jgi:hypothetical protein
MKQDIPFDKASGFLLGVLLAAPLFWGPSSTKPLLNNAMLKYCKRYIFRAATHQHCEI